ncbi:MAG: STAS domain-containing protein [Gammaproteobacteria bacterium]|nr:STAS domain-containing protein [Gammaproteobacteria bacterium]
MSIHIDKDEEKKEVRIKVSGNFDFSIHPQFRNSYQDLDKSYSVIVDLKNTNYMDSAALGMLLLLDDEFSNHRIKIVNCNDFIKQVFQIAHFEKKFDIEQ